MSATRAQWVTAILVVIASLLVVGREFTVNLGPMVVLAVMSLVATIDTFVGNGHRGPHVARWALAYVTTVTVVNLVYNAVAGHSVFALILAALLRLLLTTNVDDGPLTAGISGRRGVLPLVIATVAFASLFTFIVVLRDNMLVYMVFLFAISASVIAVMAKSRWPSVRRLTNPAFGGLLLSATSVFAVDAFNKMLAVNPGVTVPALLMAGLTWVVMIEVNRG